MQVRRLTIERFRGHEQLEWCPRQCNLILGANNTGKSTILEALDWLFDPGWGRPRPVPVVEDFWRLRPHLGFRIEAVLGGLTPADLADFDNFFEGWRSEDETLVSEPDGPGLETVVRVEVRGTEDGELHYRMAKPEIPDTPFSARLRRKVNFVFDGRRRDPARQLGFYQGSVLEHVFGEVDLTVPLRGLAQHLSEGQDTVNADAGVNEVLQLIRERLRDFGIGGAGEALLTVGSVSDRMLLQTLSLALRQDAELALPVNRLGRGVQRVTLVALLLALAARRTTPAIAAFEEPEEALEPFRVRMLGKQLRALGDAGGQIFVTSHSPDVLRCFRPDEVVLLEPPGTEPRLVELRRRLTPAMRMCVQRQADTVGRAMFSPAALLVDGPSDQAVVEVFWDYLAGRQLLPSSEILGVQPVACEGTGPMPGIARTLVGLGKVVIALFDRDADPDRQRDRADTAAEVRSTILHRSATRDLEGLLAVELPLSALPAGIDAIGADLGLAWGDVRSEIVERLPEGVPAEHRTAAHQAGDWHSLAGAVEDEFFREALRLAFKGVRLRVKSPWIARLFAEAAVAEAAVPPSIRRVIDAVTRTVTTHAAMTIDLDQA